MAARLGRKIARRVPEVRLVRSLGWLFLAIGIITIVEALSG